MTFEHRVHLSARKHVLGEHHQDSSSRNTEDFTAHRQLHSLITKRCCMKYLGVALEQATAINTAPERFYGFGEYANLWDKI